MEETYRTNSKQPEGNSPETNYDVSLLRGKNLIMNQLVLVVSCVIFLMITKNI